MSSNLGYLERSHDQHYLEGKEKRGNIFLDFKLAPLFWGNSSTQRCARKHRDCRFWLSTSKRRRNTIVCGGVKMNTGKMWGRKFPSTQSHLKGTGNISPSVVHVPESAFGFPFEYYNLLFSLSAAAQFLSQERSHKGQYPAFSQLLSRECQLKPYSVHFLQCSASHLQLALMHCWHVAQHKVFFLLHATEQFHCSNWGFTALLQGTLVVPDLACCSVDSGWQLSRHKPASVCLRVLP